jgi:hypothetical protein
MRYHVELRRHDEEGDYTEDQNSFDVHSVHDYEDRDYDPINLKY